jgi:hypothetical protein
LRARQFELAGRERADLYASLRSFSIMKTISGQSAQSRNASVGRRGACRVCDESDSHHDALGTDGCGMEAGINNTSASAKRFVNWYLAKWLWRRVYRARYQLLKSSRECGSCRNEF